ncbi:hypothetical protein M1D97_06385 [Kushneria sp. AK178]
MSVKGLLSLVFGLTLVASGIWLTLDQGRQERQWNLKQDAASGVMSGSMPGDEATADESDQDSSDDSGIVSVLP